MYENKSYLLIRTFFNLKTEKRTSVLSKTQTSLAFFLAFISSNFNSLQPIEIGLIKNSKMIFDTNTI